MELSNKNSKLYTALLLIAILFICNQLLSQDLQNCSLIEVNLFDETTIQFDQDCGCNSTPNCAQVRINLNDSQGQIYECQGMAIQLVSEPDFNEDYIDVYLPDGCQELDPWSGTPSRYGWFIDSFQTGGYIDALICIGDNDHFLSTGAPISFYPSDYCFPALDPCDNDTTPPTCIVEDITIETDSSTTMAIINFSDYFEDDCSGIESISGIDKTNGVDVTDGVKYPCGSTIEFTIFATDGAGNQLSCDLTITIECGSECENTAIHFDGIDDYIEFNSPYSGDQGYTIEMWVKSESFSTGGCSNNSSSDMDWILSFDDNNLGIVDCAGGLRVIFRPLCPHGNGLCSGLPTRPINDDNWHHIAISESQSTGFRVYYDGVKFTNFDRAVYDLSGKIRLGNKFGNGPGNPFKGAIDEVRLWDYVRTDEEILLNSNCKLNTPIDGLVTYFDFSDGLGLADNQTISEVNDLAGLDQNGILSNFNLIGDFSNFICTDLTLVNCLVPTYCEEECQADVVNLSTGVSFIDGSLLPLGSYEGGWQMISGPDAGLTYPRPGYVLRPDGAWHTLPGAQYISPFPNASNNEMYDEPYLFERSFCVCADNSKVSLDVSALFDNFINIGLYDEDGTLIEELISYDGPAAQSTFRLPALTSSTVHILNTGIYSIRAGLRNDGGVSMGMSINAILSGAGLIESGCCSPFTIITGTVFDDMGCDGVNDYGTDTGIGGVEVVLCDEKGEEIASVVTDAFGYYVFSDLDPGIYMVKQKPIEGKDMSLGSDGYTVELSLNTVIGDIDFGNCDGSQCCVSSEELSNAVYSGVSVSSIICLEEGGISIEKPQLYDCQYISEILWGDGTIATLNPGDEIPEHSYEANGVYLISVTVIAVNENGDTCQVDIIDLPILYKDCVLSTDFSNSSDLKFKVYPIPATDILNIEISKNVSGFSASIYNTSGNVIEDFNVEQGVTNISKSIEGLSPGLYFLILENKDLRSLKTRFIKL